MPGFHMIATIAAQIVTVAATAGKKKETSDRCENQNLAIHII